MRRVNPLSLQRHRSFRQLLVSKRASAPIISIRSAQIPTRAFASGSAVSYPRSGPYARYQSSSATPAEEEEVNESVFDHDIEDLSTSGGDDASLPSLPPFEDFVVSVIHPETISDPLPEELRPLHHHLLTAFLPANQHIQSPAATAESSRSNFVLPGGWQPVAAPETQEPQQSPESVLALVSPFEGGRHYVQDAVRRVASEIDADVLSFDLALGLGLDGSHSPLGQAGCSAPALHKATNPLLQDSPRPSPSAPFASPLHHMEEDMEEQDDDGESRSSNAIIVSPLMGRLSGSGMPGITSINDTLQDATFQEDWVAFFEHWINKGEDANRKRVILLESVEAMSATFDEWWPSLVEAVRRRRRSSTRESIHRKKSESPKQTGFTLLQPTIIVFSSAPSLLRPHTAGGSTAVKDGLESSVTQIHPMLQEIAEKYGGTVETKVENSEAGPLWWGSEEMDAVGRQERDNRRLAALLDHSKGPMSLLPGFGARGIRNAQRHSGRHPLLDILAGQAGGLTGRTPSLDGSKSDHLIWKALSVIPAERNRGKELLERVTTRSLIGSGLLGKAVAELGGELVDPVTAAFRLEVDNAKHRRSQASPVILKLQTDPEGPQIINLLRGKPYAISVRGWQNAVRSWRSIKELAVTAIGQKLSEPREPELLPSGVRISWKDALNASRIDKGISEKARKRIQQLLPRKVISSKIRKASETTPTESVVDAVVNRVKKAKDLNSHEKRLLGCIVDTTKLASTTFNDVHLPYKTIDAIRTIISLPLLFPDAFKGGVLRDHSTTGALLFGPPGTGKTLLARAVANESGATMLAIQPSDVNDKYFGEGEKLVKAVFSLARRLSPCVVFLDEVDALFGARSSRGAGFGNKAHDQLLTEFMQEMDGLSSAEINKDKRIVVVGATNRPFDLDDAVLRRLPRRLLVDLPGPADRKAILQILLRNENLGDDVVLDNIVKDTDGYSGSDLKHLCVSAALAAVKDSVQVPWDKTVLHKNHEPSHTPPQESSSPSGLDRNENFVLEASEDPKPELIAEPNASLSVDIADPPQVVLPLAYSGSKEEGKENIPGSLAEDSPDFDGVAHSTIPAHGDKDEGVILNTKTASRILTKKHFDVALAEIRPSSSEEGSLPELRKWAEQFGEGGSQKGRKKGFGKGFGFGDPSNKSDRDRGYGKVTEDD